MLYNLLCLQLSFILENILSVLIGFKKVHVFFFQSLTQLYTLQYSFIYVRDK